MSLRIPSQPNGSRGDPIRVEESLTLPDEHPSSSTPVQLRRLEVHPHPQTVDDGFPRPVPGREQGSGPDPPSTGPRRPPPRRTGPERPVEYGVGTRSLFPQGDRPPVSRLDRTGVPRFGEKGVGYSVHLLRVRPTLVNHGDRHVSSVEGQVHGGTPFSVRSQTESDLLFENGRSLRYTCPGQGPL